MEGIQPSFRTRILGNFIKEADEKYSNADLDMHTLNDDDQMLFVHLVLEHANNIVRCIQAGE